LASNEKTSSKVGSIAAKGMKSPASLKPKQVQSVSASASTQRPDKKPASKKK
jgi:hypothetical protein